MSADALREAVATDGRIRGRVFRGRRVNRVLRDAGLPLERFVFRVHMVVRDCYEPGGLFIERLVAWRLSAL
jgi:hypothetical protein